MIHIRAMNRNEIFFCDKAVSASEWNVCHTEYTWRVFLLCVSADGLPSERSISNIFYNEYIWRAFDCYVSTSAFLNVMIVWNTFHTEYI